MDKRNSGKKFENLMVDTQNDKFTAHEIER